MAESAFTPWNSIGKHSNLNRWVENKHILVLQSRKSGSSARIDSGNLWSVIVFAASTQSQIPLYLILDYLLEEMFFSNCDNLYLLIRSLDRFISRLLIKGYERV